MAVPDPNTAPGPMVRGLTAALDDIAKGRLRTVRADDLLGSPDTTLNTMFTLTDTWVDQWAQVRPTLDPTLAETVVSLMTGISHEARHPAFVVHPHPTHPKVWLSDYKDRFTLAFTRDPITWLGLVIH